MFIGRKKEYESLQTEFASKKRTAVLVYGKRRVGKSMLLKEVSKTFDGIVVNHLCVKSSFEGNLDLLTKSLMFSLGLPEMKFSTIFDLFSFPRPIGDAENTVPFPGFGVFINRHDHHQRY